MQMALSLLQANMTTTPASDSSTVIITTPEITEDIDPQFDTGNVGSTILSFGNGMDDGTAVFVYGVMAGI